jgi:O-acetylserine/cysteine efflux transporter
MTTDRRRAIAALIAAGLLWGTTVPLSKLALGWLPPGWLTFARFGLAAAILLVVARDRVRAVCTPAVLASGAIGYGGAVVVQNAGISRTSVSHAALLIGAAPVLIAVIAALWQHTMARPVAWAGFALSLAGVGVITGGGGGGATAGGDGMVLASLLLSSTFTVAQVRLLRGRDPVAVTAVQFLGAALAMLPFAAVTEGMPPVPASPGVVLAVAGLAAGGTLLPFTLFAFGQSRVSAEVAGAFLNLEPFVGAVAGVVLFGNPAGPVQIAGGAAILAGIALSGLPLLAGRRVRPGVPAGVRACGPSARTASVHDDQVPGVRVVVGEPDAPAAGPRLDGEALRAGGHGGAQRLAALVGPEHARAGAGGAVPGLAAVPGDVHVAAATRQQNRASRGDRDGVEVTGGRRAGQPLPGAPVAGGQVGALELLARARLAGAAERQGEAGRGGQAERPPRAGRADRVPPRRGVRGAGQQRRRPQAGAVVRAGRGHVAGPRGHGHLRRGHAPPEHPRRSRRAGDRPPPVPRHGCRIHPEPAAPWPAREASRHRGDHPAAAGREAAHRPSVQA